MPKISVVLPVYNGAETLGAAIQSIQVQTFIDWELIAIDDGSSDSSYEKLQAFSLADQRIRIFQNPQNIGLAATMNHAVLLAAGEYIAVQEQDDTSVPQRLQLEAALLDTKPEIDLVSGIADWLDDNLDHSTYFPGLLAKGEQYPQDHQSMFQFLYLEQCKVVNAGCMFRHCVLDGWSQPFNESARMSIDWEFFLRLSRKSCIWGIPTVVVKMRRGSNRLSLTKNKKLQFSEARRCINLIYHDYRHAPQSKVTFHLWRQAMSNELVLEARWWSRLSGLSLLLQAMLLSPTNPQVWNTWKWFVNKLYAKMR